MQILVCYDVDKLKSTCNAVSNFSRKLDIFITSMLKLDICDH